MDDEGVKEREVDFGAEIFADAPPAFEPVCAWRAVGHAAPFVVVVHARGTCSVTARYRAAAQTLRVAALTLCCASSPSTLLWALWWKDTEKWGILIDAEKKKKNYILGFKHYKNSNGEALVKIQVCNSKQAHLTSTQI